MNKNDEDSIDLACEILEVVQNAVHKKKRHENHEWLIKAVMGAYVQLVANSVKITGDLDKSIEDFVRPIRLSLKQQFLTKND